MTRSRRTRSTLEAFEGMLEPRDLLSHVPAGWAAIAEVRAERLAHQPVLGPATFHKATIETLKVRLSTSSTVTIQINNAFQAFTQNYLKVPVSAQGTNLRIPLAAIGNTANLQIGTIPSPPTLNNYIQLLNQQISQALSLLQFTTNRVQPSLQNAPRFTPRAQDSLIPFAQTQLSELEQYLQTNPPVYNQDGTLANSGPIDAVNRAFNAILNSVGEYSVHPTLFTKPSDFYINPNVHFKIPYTSTPANDMPNVFILGPGGVPIYAVRRHR